MVALWWEAATEPYLRSGIGSGIARQLITLGAGHTVLLDNAESDLYDLEMELRKKPGLFVLPNSIEAAYKLKKAGTLPQRIAFLVRLKAERHSPTAEAIQSLFPRIEKPESSGKPKSVPDFQRIFSNVRNACSLAAADYGERNSVLLNEVEGVLEELNRLREHLMEKVETKELEEK